MKDAEDSASCRNLRGPPTGTRVHSAPVPDPPERAPDSEPTAEPVEGELVPAEVGETRPLPVLAEGGPAALEGSLPVSLPATVVAAAGGFMCGIAAFVAVRLLRRPSAGRSLARRRRRLLARRRGVDIESTRSFLVDVHLLKR